jgi:hypothetical protein
MLNMLNTPAKVNRKMQPDIVHFCDALPLGNDARPYCEQLIERQIRVKNVSDTMTETRPAEIDSCTLTNACRADGRPIRFRKDPGKVKHLVEAVRRDDEFF